MLTSDIRIKYDICLTLKIRQVGIDFFRKSHNDAFFHHDFPYLPYYFTVFLAIYLAIKIAVLCYQGLTTDVDESKY